MKGKTMENKQIEELALKAGFIEHKQYLQSFDFAQDVQDRLIREFAKLVEQATLERAAKEFEQDECDNWRSDVYAGHAVTRIIRALKDSNG